MEKKNTLPAHMSERIAPEVIECAEWLESMGLDPFGRDGFELSTRLDWFSGDCEVAGVTKQHIKALRGLFIRWAAPLMASNSSNDVEGR